MRVQLQRIFGCWVVCVMLLVQPAHATCVLDGTGVIDALPFELQKLLVAPAGEEKVCRLEPGYQPTEPEKDRILPSAPFEELPVEGAHVADEVLVTVRGGRDEIAQLVADYGLELRSFTPVSVLGGVLVRFGIPDGRSVGQVQARLLADPLVMMSAPNHIYELNGSSLEGRYSVKLTGLEKAQKLAQGRGVKVAIVDGAVDLVHPALKQGIVGRFDGLDQIPVQDTGHGTVVALLLGGRGAPFLGAAPKAELYVARAFDKRGKGGGPANTVFAILASLDWALIHKVDVVNMSFSGPANAMLALALEDLLAEDVILVAAAGNGGEKAPPSYPAAYKGVFAVTAVDAKRRVYGKANRGDYVFVAAPGVDLLVSQEKGRVKLVSGTSYGAALFSGIAALALEKGALEKEALDQNKNRDLVRFREWVETSVLDLGDQGHDEVYGHGLVRAHLLVQRSLKP